MADSLQKQVEEIRNQYEELSRNRRVIAYIDTNYFFKVTETLLNYVDVLELNKNIK